MPHFHIILLALAPFVGYFGVSQFLAVNHKWAARRKNAAAVGAALKAWGLSITPDFLLCFATGDIEGMFSDLERYAIVLEETPDAVLNELNEVFDNVLAAKLQSAAGRAAIQAKLTAALATPATS